MTKTNDALKNATREELLSVIMKISEVIDSHESAEWIGRCPKDVLSDGSYDDAWAEGQDNGEAYMASKIKKIISIL